MMAYLLKQSPFSLLQFVYGFDKEVLVHSKHQPYEKLNRAQWECVIKIKFFSDPGLITCGCFSITLFNGKDERPKLPKTNLKRCCFEFDKF